MDDLLFNELDTLVLAFSVGASCGIFLGFVVWCVHSAINAFKKFF